jgi:hypothetical protein
MTASLWSSPHVANPPAGYSQPAIRASSERRNDLLLLPASFVAD